MQLWGARVTVAADRLSFASMLERLYAEKHTGPIVVHFAQGCPNVMEIPGEAVRIPLDKPERRPHT